MVITDSSWNDYSMIKEIGELFQTVVNSLVKAPFATLTTILLLCLVYIGYYSIGKLDTLVVSPVVEAERFQNHLVASEQVGEALEKLKVEQGAHSASIRQFHNGKYDLTGIPFTTSTMTFYTDGITHIEDEPLAAMGKVLNRMWKKIDAPVCTTLEYGIDASTKHFMDEYELKYIVVCPMTNLLKYPVGTLTVGYKDKNSMDVSKVHEAAKRVTGYLNGTN